MSTATTCAKCSHATRPLPSDWTTVDFFDKPVVAQEAVFRTTCTAAPDADKPCLRPAPAAPSTSETDADMGGLGLVRMDARRQNLCLEIVWEIEHIARLLPNLVPTNDSGDTAPHFLARSMAGRLLRLSSAMGAALSDESEPTERLERVVNFESGQG